MTRAIPPGRKNRPRSDGGLNFASEIGERCAFPALRLDILGSLRLALGCGRIYATTERQDTDWIDGE